MRRRRTNVATAMLVKRLWRTRGRWRKSCRVRTTPWSPEEPAYGGSRDDPATSLPRSRSHADREGGAGAAWGPAQPDRGQRNEDAAFSRRSAGGAGAEPAGREADLSCFTASRRFREQRGVTWRVEPLWSLSARTACGRPVRMNRDICDGAVHGLLKRGASPDTMNDGLRGHGRAASAAIMTERM